MFNYEGPFSSAVEGAEVRIYYVVTDEQRAALPLMAQVALAITSDAVRQSFPNPQELTKTLMEETGLDRESLVKQNQKLHNTPHKYTELSTSIDQPKEITLHLTDAGMHYLAEQVTEVGGLVMQVDENDTVVDELCT